MNPHRRQRWLRQWVAAAKRNTQLQDLQKIATSSLQDRTVDGYGRIGGAGVLAGPIARAFTASIYVARELRYRFVRGENAPILALDDAIARGWGACGDGSAAVAVVALLAGAERVVLCYEDLVEEALRMGGSVQMVPDPGYAHVRVVVDGEGVDPFPEQSWDVASCAATLDVRELLGWPTTAAAKR